MPQLPTSGLTGTPVNDHISHHEALHAFYNVSETAGSPVGSVIMRNSAGQWTIHMPFRTFPTSTFVHNHSTAGVATMTIGSTIKAIRINASANITGITVNGFTLNNYGEFGSIWVRVIATSTIQFSLSNVNVVGDAPATLTAGQSTVFQLQRWDF